MANKKTFKNIENNSIELKEGDKFYIYNEDMSDKINEVFTVSRFISDSDVILYVDSNNKRGTVNNVMVHSIAQDKLEDIDDDSTSSKSNIRDLRKDAIYTEMSPPDYRVNDRLDRDNAARPTESKKSNIEFEPVEDYMENKSPRNSSVEASTEKRNDEPISNEVLGTLADNHHLNSVIADIAKIIDNNRSDLEITPTYMVLSGSSNDNRLDSQFGYILSSLKNNEMSPESRNELLKNLSAIIIEHLVNQKAKSSQW